jgi:two-component system cell cycle sensor histidine kinase/response regulator CckA
MKRILVVEDERIVARDLQMTLESQGYTVTGVAASSDEAIASATAAMPDLVLMDVHIKGERDGIDTARLLRERFRLPVIYLTAYADAETLDRAKTTQPYGYLIKPFNDRELRSVIEVALYRHDVDARLHARERWFATTLRSIGDAVVATDAEGLVVFMNTAAELMTGRPEGEARGKPAAQVLRLLDVVTGVQVVDPIAQALARREVVHVQGEAMLQEAERTWSVEASASPIVGERDEIQGAVLVFRDVGERRRLQQQVELAEKLASLGTISAGIAHEINNPLAAVFGNIDFIGTQVTRLVDAVREGRFQLDATWQGRLTDIAQTIDDTRLGAERIRNIVDDMRLFSRAHEPQRVRVEVDRSIDWAVRMTAGQVKNRARVVTDMEKVPRVEASESRLGQVLVNLIVNAAQAIPEALAAAGGGEIIVRTRFEAGAAGTSAGTGAGHVIIEVADNGVGIPAERLHRIFDPFFTTRPVGVGTGLGLSICHGIVSSLNGTLTVQSKVGEGSTFRVSLPATAEVRRPPLGSTSAADAAGMAARPEPGEPARRGRVLVIDDDAMVVRTIDRTLRERHEVTCITEPRLALDAIRAGAEFDVIICDLMMPKTSGAWVYEQVLALDPGLADRILFVSGALFVPEMQSFLESVSNPRLEKPFAPRDLSGLVEDFLAEHGWR